jgi:hypothetical protein
MYGNELVVLAVHDQGWNIDLLEILGEIGTLLRGSEENISEYTS